MNEEKTYCCPICGKDTPYSKPRCANCEELPPLQGLTKRTSNVLRAAGMASKDDFLRFWNKRQTHTYNGVVYMSHPVQELLKYRGVGKKNVNELLVWVGLTPIDWGSPLNRSRFLMKDAPKLYAELLNAVSVHSDTESKHDTILRYIRDAETKESR